jgi:hypothetical protein
MPSINTIETKDELDRLVSNLPEGTASAVLKNIKAKIKMGTTELSAPITSAFVTEEAIVLLKEGKMSQEEFQKELEKKGNRNAISFLPLEEESTRSKDIALVSTMKALREELLKRVEVNDDICTFYPKMKGYIDLYYLTEEGKREKLGREKLQGVLDFEEKMLIFTKPIPYKNLARVLWEEEIYMGLDWSVNLPFQEYSGIGQK